MALNQKNFGRLTEGYTLIIGIGIAIAIAGIIAFGVLLLFGVSWFSVPLIFAFLGLWIAASQWNELGKLRIVTGLITSITHPTRITTAANLLNMKKHTFVHALTKLITRGVVEIDIFPEVDALGPKGCKRPKSVPKDYQITTVTPSVTHQRLGSGLQWVGLIGTIIAIVYHIIALLRFFGTF